MRRFSVFAAVSAVAMLTLGSPAIAQYTPALPVTNKVTFVTVDSVYMHWTTLRVTGIVQGEASASEYEVSFLSSSDPSAGRIANCQRLALLAMDRPGAYLFTLRNEGSNYYSCRLTRVNP
jgi:hypothetical protein